MHRRLWWYNIWSVSPTDEMFDLQFPSLLSGHFLVETLSLLLVQLFVCLWKGNKVERRTFCFQFAGRTHPQKDGRNERSERDVLWVRMEERFVFANNEEDRKQTMKKCIYSFLSCLLPGIIPNVQSSRHEEIKTAIRIVRPMPSAVFFVVVPSELSTQSDLLSSSLSSLTRLLTLLIPLSHLQGIKTRKFFHFIVKNRS